MGSDDFFKKRKAQLKERKHATRIPKPNSFLIVTEGKKTEPLYFDGLARHINNRYGHGIDVIPRIDTRGEGKNTVSLVQAASQIVNQAHVIYEHVWVVFDKDDFKNFDDAIRQAESMGFNVAWSNQCFEYWIYLHFHYSDSALHREIWYDNSNLNSMFENIAE